MKRVITFLFSLLLLLSISTIAFAHSGRTDSNGGHHDYTNGGYHYHHGYPEHQHPNGECPYLSKSTESNTSGGAPFSTSFVLAICIGPALGVLSFMLLSWLLSLFKIEPTIFEKSFPNFFLVFAIIATVIVFLVAYL